MKNIILLASAFSMFFPTLSITSAWAANGLKLGKKCRTAISEATLIEISQRAAQRKASEHKARLKKLRKEAAQLVTKDLTPSHLRTWPDLSPPQVLAYGELGSPIQTENPGKVNSKSVQIEKPEKWHFAIVIENENPEHRLSGSKKIFIWGVKNPNKKRTWSNVKLHRFSYASNSTTDIPGRVGRSGSSDSSLSSLINGQDSHESSIELVFDQIDSDGNPVLIANFKIYGIAPYRYTFPVIKEIIVFDEHIKD